MRLTIFAPLLVLLGISTALGAEPIEKGEIAPYAQIAGRPNPLKLKITFVPSLAAQLLAAEKIKHAPLDQREVESIRDAATVRITADRAARAVEERRGYRDLEPTQSWAEWQAMRAGFDK